jgi:cell wall-associated NlpC family hydrolase
VPGGNGTAAAPAQALEYDGCFLPAVLDEYEDGSTVNLAAGGKVTVPEGYTLTFSKGSIASHDNKKHEITVLKAGKTTVSYREIDDDPDDEWYDGDTGSFTLNVISYDALQKKTHRAPLIVNEWGGAESSLTLKAKGVEYPSGGAAVLSDSVKDPWDKREPDAQIDDLTSTGIILLFDKAGMHTVKLAINGRSFTIKVKVVCLALNRESLVLCKGKSATLKVAHAKGVKFASDNTLVAKVSKKGKVTPRQLGNTTVRVTAEGHTFTCAVGVTSKKGYKAVKNAEADLKKKYVYSQPKRMQKSYRDCSSFVSRCYWDLGLGRKLFLIGGNDAKNWAYPAAEQAQWLNRKHKRVAYKAVSADKLLPGDTLYFETDYAGRNKSYRHIDHAGIYVGGGLYLNTGGYGGKGAVGYRQYRPGDSSVKYIGRPISSFVPDRASVTVKKGKVATLKPLFAKGKVVYKSSKPKVAKVSKAGKVTGKKAGTATITAHCKAGTYRCKVTVK